MVEERVQRRLAAILAVDVAGFSRMMDGDEAGTLSRLKCLRRKIFAPTVEAHGGRIVKLMGDGALVEFPSAVDAVHCAVAFQEKVHARNAGASQSEVIQFRIGINIGDVIVEGRDIYGAGVNIAARLESIADPGSIFVSQNAYEQARKTTKLHFAELGERQLKNIATPVLVYRIEESDHADQRRQGSATVLNRPAVAVLPFTNMSGDQEQEYFADGLTEDLITALSHWRLFPVISRMSVFAYKGKQAMAQQVARELGASYILEGSVRKVANHVRITTQLIDAETGHHIWAHSFDREITDIIALQDEITRRVAKTMQPELARAEGQRSSAKPLTDLTAWDYFQRGLFAHWKYTLEANAKARELFKQAIKIDPEYSQAYTGLSLADSVDIALGAPGDQEFLAQKALQSAKRAVELDVDDAWAHLALAFAYHRTNQLELAISEARKSVDLNPSDPSAHLELGSALDYSGRSGAGIASFKTALALLPHHGKHLSRCRVALGYLHTQDFEGAAEVAREAINAEPDYPSGYVTLTAALAHLGRLDEARKVLARGEAIEADLVEKWHEWPLYHVEVQKQLVIDGLQQAGWKGDPSELPSLWQTNDRPSKGG